MLGEQIELITADDYCDGEQAVAAANKLVADGVVAVFGHQCSGAAIPASKIYADAGILMISNGATNPKLTEQGFTNVFRVVGRDDVQGRIAGDLLAERWGNKPIAILHDGQAYGKGLAEETRKRLNERGIAEAMFEAIEPGKADYWDVVQKMQAMGVEVLYFGGYQHEAGLIIRQAREHGYELQLVAGDGISDEDFGLIAGPASDGTLMTLYSIAERSRGGRVRGEVHRGCRDLRFEPYAAFQAGRRRSRRRARSRPKRWPTHCARTSSTPCSAASASTRRATSPATRPSSGTSGRTASTRRWNRASSPSETDRRNMGKPGLQSRRVFWSQPSWRWGQFRGRATPAPSDA